MIASSRYQFIDGTRGMAAMADAAYRFAILWPAAAGFVY